MRELTGEQRAAVARRRGPLALAAAAGSGKTSVLVERFVAAVREDGLAPAQVLAITFTERAAGELRERVRARFLELDMRAAARDTEAAAVSTFHGFCARLLRASALHARLDPEFTILDEGLAARLRQRAFARALGGLLEGGADEQAVDLAAAYGADRLRGLIEGVYATLRSQGESVPRLPGAVGEPAAAVRACIQLDRLLALFGSAYEESKRRRSALDFDDLELRARELLLGAPAIRAAWAGRYELLMVDEFQDTNRRQLDVLAALDRDNLFTVGDELQAIYGFRHADVRLFRERSAELAVTGAELALTQNFRSRRAILDVVNTVFGERFDGFTAASAARQEGAAPAVELLVAARAGWSEHPALEQQIRAGMPRAALWRQAEARMLARRLAELVDGGDARGGDIAVLLRALGDIHVYERALQQAGLRTIAAAGAFWEHQQVEDLIAYLRALANPLDEVALYGALASPLAAETAAQGADARPAGVSREGLALLTRAARALGTGAFEAALTASPQELAAIAERDRFAIQAFAARLAAERAELARRSIAELLERAIAHEPYRRQLTAGAGAARGMANLNKLLRLARRFEQREGRDLRAFLDHVAFLRQSSRGGEAEAPVEGVEPDAVRLMSIHAAKGLEFPVVCIADLGRTPNSRLPDLLVDGERIGLNLVALDGSDSTPTLDYEQLAVERREEEAAEEDRIAYVAMTRARDLLLLSGSIDLERWAEGRANGAPLAWIGPALSAGLPSELLQAAQESRYELVLDVGADDVAASVRCTVATPLNPQLVGATGPVAGEQLALALEDAPVAAAPAPAPSGGSSPVAAVPADPSQRQGARRPAAAPPATGDDLPAVLSYSALDALERCGYRYYLERVLGLPEDRHRDSAGVTGERLDARERGTLVHRLLEDTDFAAPQGPSSERIRQVAGELGLAPSAREADGLAVMIGAALRAEPAARVARARDTRREQPFAFSLSGSGQLIGGVIDLLAREQDGGALVVDYKSNALRPGEDLEELVERDYSLQREIYALAVLLDGAAHVDIVHWFLERPEDHVAVRYAARERGTLEGLIEQRLEHARRAGFAVSTAPHRGLCAGCPGRSGLCSWGDEETLRELPGKE